MYIIIKCEALDDQYECDAMRTPKYWCNTIKELEQFINWMKKTSSIEYEIWKGDNNTHCFSCLVGLDNLYYPDEVDDTGYQLQIYDDETVQFLNDVIIKEKAERR